MNLELSQVTVKNLLVEQIRGEIIRGTYMPGQRLRLRDLADYFKISTMPVREALSELEAEGIVTSEPRKGAVVTRFSPEELQDIYDIRATLEAMATRFAVPNLSEPTLDDLSELIEEMDQKLGHVVQLVNLNYVFHTTLYAVSGRKHLCELTQTLRHRTAHYLHAYIREQGRMPQAQDEHRAIVEACRQGDADSAAAVMYSHVANAGKGIIAYLEEERESMATE